MAQSLILFGAGASFGSEHNTKTPPIGARLYEELAAFNPDGWGRVDAIHAKKLREDFEDGVRLLAENAPHSLPPLQRAMAAYFFQFFPSEENLYVQLACKIASRSWDGALATLNYERLLEIAILNSGLRPVVGSASHGDQIEVCLPHGSCHIFCDSVRALASAVSFSAPGVTTNGPISVIGDPIAHRQRISNDAFPPVMSYFEPQKRTTSGNNFIEAQRARFAELVDHARVVAIVGLRVRAHDIHVWEPLARSSARIVYCSGSSAGKEFQQWSQRSRGSASHDTILEGYFRENFARVLSEVGLG